jgi:hypothetical protein
LTVLHIAALKGEFRLARWRTEFHVIDQKGAGKAAEALSSAETGKAGACREEGSVRVKVRRSQDGCAISCRLADLSLGSKLGLDAPRRPMKPNRIRGRIGHVTDREISLQVLQYGNIQDRAIRLDELQSISVVDSLEIVSIPEMVHRIIGYGLAISLTVVAVLALIGGMLLATRGGG